MLKDGSIVDFSWGDGGNLYPKVTTRELKEFFERFSQITSTTYKKKYPWCDVDTKSKEQQEFSFIPEIDYLSSIHIKHTRKNCKFRDRRKYRGQINIDLEVITNAKYLGEFEEMVKRLKDEFPEWKFKKNWGVSELRDKVGDNKIENPYVDKSKAYELLIEEIANGTLPSAEFLKRCEMFNNILPDSLKRTGDLRRDLIRATISYSMETGQFHRIKDQIGDEKDFVVDAINKTIVSSILKGTFHDNISKYLSEYSSFLGQNSIRGILESEPIKTKLLDSLANTRSEENVYNVIISENLSYLNDAQAILKKKMDKLLEEYAKERDPNIATHLADLNLVIKRTHS
jgi:hypothetical protein